MDRDEAVDKAKSYLLTRQQAYQQVFNPENEYVKRVIEDLKWFCRANESTFHPDARVHAVMEGRREVYLRILEQLTLSSEEILARHLKKGEGR